MPCPHRTDLASLRRATRRDVLKRALAVGGTGALAACLKQRGMPEVPRGTLDPSDHPERQHAWNEYLVRDPHGNTVSPPYQLILFLEYANDGVPVDAERRQVESALRSLERVYQWGNGGRNSQRPGGRTTGLLFTIGYSSRYFERFDAELPESVDLQAPEATLRTLDEPADRAADCDAVMVLTSHYAQVLLAVEQALFGGVERLNGVDVSGTFDGIFGRVERRTGFKRAGLPREKLDREEISQQSPSAMGFKSGFVGNQASEDSVTIRDGPFGEGTTQHVSKLRVDLDAWYDRDRETRVDLMFSPNHSPDDIGEAGEFLSGDSGVTLDIASGTAADAREEGVVGHTQKLARARDSEFTPKILRRSEAVSAAGDDAIVNFTSVQRRIADFVETREAMNSTDLRDEIADDHNGIVSYLTVESRANLLVPPRTHRALPVPDPR